MFAEIFIQHDIISNFFQDRYNFFAIFLLIPKLPTHNWLDVEFWTSFIQKLKVKYLMNSKLLQISCFKIINIPTKLFDGTLLLWVCLPK